MATEEKEENKKRELEAYNNGVEYYSEYAQYFNRLTDPNKTMVLDKYGTPTGEAKRIPAGRGSDAPPSSTHYGGKSKRKSRKKSKKKKNKKKKSRKSKK